MYILIDIGGTKTRVAATNRLDGEIEVLDKVSTPQDPREGVEVIERSIREAGVNTIDGLCAGIAGAIDRKRDTVCRSPNLPNWSGYKLVDNLCDRVGAEHVYVVNDTALGALGEAYEGAGTEDGVTAYFTVGTGVGGSRVVNGQLDTARFGFEPGHQVVNLEDFLDLGDNLPEEGRIPGHLEYYLGGSSMEDRVGKKPPEIKDEIIWDEFQDRLVAALINVSVMWVPDDLVVGGSMIFRNEFLSFAYLQKQLEKKLSIYPAAPTVQRAVLQDDAGLVGAQIYLRLQK